MISSEDIPRIWGEGIKEYRRGECNYDMFDIS
jgi:hypothetical protein